jgi:hypothetical protein
MTCSKALQRVNGIFANLCMLRSGGHSHRMKTGIHQLGDIILGYSGSLPNNA